MKPIINYNGVVREMTDAEYEEYLQNAENIPQSEKSDAERIAELEAQLAALTEGYAEGVNQA